MDNLNLKINDYERVNFHGKTMLCEDALPTGDFVTGIRKEQPYSCDQLITALRQDIISWYLINAC